MGPSLGGNISALIAYNHPEVFGLCGLHSGAFQTNNFEAYNLIINGEVKDIKWSSIWGSYEGSLSQNMRDFRDALILKGYELDWLELPEGHGWGLWRATIDNVLKYFFPFQPTDVSFEQIQMPEGLILYQNYPNPFNPVTTIRFRISPARTKFYAGGDLRFTTLKVYNILGNEIATLIKKEAPAGVYEVTFDATSLPSGVYLYHLHTGSFNETKRMILLK
jgi:enterochelin esterase family protein